MTGHDLNIVFSGEGSWGSLSRLFLEPFFVETLSVEDIFGQNKEISKILLRTQRVGGTGAGAVVPGKIAVKLYFSTLN